MALDAIGVIGLGNLGASMVQRLLREGRSVVAYDLRSEALNAAVAAGAMSAPDPRALAEACDVVLTCLPTVDASLAVAAEVGATSRPRAYIETSTVGPRVIDEIAARVGEHRLVDAPVSGGPPAARAGVLAAFVAAGDEAFASARPWLDVLMGKAIRVGGRPGLGQIVKLVNNAMSLSAMTVACEALSVGVAAGIDAEVLLEAVNAGTAASSATLVKIPRHVLTGTFDYGGPVALAAKDVTLYRTLAEEVGLRGLTSADATLSAIDRTVRMFGDDADYSELVRPFEAATGIEVRASSDGVDRPSKD